MQQLARRLRTADQTIESDRAYASGPRLARYLKRLIRKAVEASQRVELSQTELGHFAGMSREHIHRQLQSWEASGLIYIRRQSDMAKADQYLSHSMVCDTLKK